MACSADEEQGLDMFQVFLGGEPMGRGQWWVLLSVPQVPWSQQTTRGGGVVLSSHDSHPCTLPPGTHMEKLVPNTNS
jgi:hypothetical protein